MRILVIGASGTIGAAVVRALQAGHEIVAASHGKSDHAVDLADPASIRGLYQAVGTVDAVVCAAGVAQFGELARLSDDDFAVSVGNKLMGQVNVVREGLPHVADGGSITLTSGGLAHHPVPGSAAVSMVSAGIEAFARAAALEAPREIRINVVSPPWVRETLQAMGRDGADGLPAATVARAYVDSVEGSAGGTVLDARDYA